jgi:hypothetical protein
VVRLVHAGGTESRTTGADGRFAFQVTEPGVYEVACAPSDDCTPTTPHSRQVVIVRRSDGTLSGYDRAHFGCADRASAVSVLGVVFEDLDRDGTQGPGEPGIPGVLLVGSVPQCPTFAPIEAWTNERGAYGMSLPPCDPPYVIHRAPLPGFVDTTPNPLVFPGPPVPGDSLPDPTDPLPPIPVFFANFGVAREGAGNEFFIDGFVYHDRDRNGRRDAGEPGLPDLGVWASGLLCMTPVSAYTRTDAGGHYRLAGRDVHCPLPWLAGSEAPPGWCATSPTRITLDGPPPDGSATFHVDFGVAPCDSIPPPQGFRVTGVVFLDTDRDGHRDPDEPGLQGVVLELMTKCDAIFRTTTDAGGRYSFRAAGCGAYAVAVVEPGFPVYTTPNPAPFDPGTPPGTELTIDFGVQRMRPPG